MDHPVIAGWIAVGATALGLAGIHLSPPDVLVTVLLLVYANAEALMVIHC